MSVNSSTPPSTVPINPSVDTSLLGTSPNPTSPGYPAIDISLLPGVPGQRGPTGPTGAASTVAGPTGPTGPTGPQGASGTFGGASFGYLFDISTVDSDPGAGYLKFNSNPFSEATEFYISFNDISGTDISAFLNTIDDSTSAIKGTFKVFNKNNDVEYAYFSIIGNHYHHGPYFEIPVAYVSGSITSMSSGEAIGITFARTGDIGDPGPTGPTGPTGPIPASTVYLASGITLTPPAFEADQTVYGTYNSGTVTDIQTYGDYPTGKYYSINDTATTPGWAAYVNFTGVTSFNRAVISVNYTNSSPHTIRVELYNWVSAAWEEIGRYTGLVNWTQFTLGVISSTNFVSGGNALLRFYHQSTGNTAHVTWIDYVALENSIQGGMGPKGDKGATGPTGPTGNPGIVPTFVMQDVLTTYTGKSRFYFEATRTITGVRASVNTAPTGSAIVAAVLLNGTSIGTVTIPAGSYTATTTLSQVVNLNDYVTINVTSVGSTIAGSDLTVTLNIN